MSSKVGKLRQMANFVLYITLQLTVAQVIVFFHTAFCFVYVGFLLLLPRRKGRLSLLLFISFAVGLLVDLFYNSIGSHALASVLMVYSRQFLLKMMLPPTGYEVTIQPTLGNLGWKRFSVFALILISIHHTVLFLPDANNAMLFFVAMRKIFFSTLLTYVAVLIMQSMALIVDKR